MVLIILFFFGVTLSYNSVHGFFIGLGSKGRISKCRIHKADWLNGRMTKKPNAWCCFFLLQFRLLVIRLFTKSAFRSSALWMSYDYICVRAQTSVHDCLKRDLKLNSIGPVNPVSHLKLFDGDGDCLWMFCFFAKKLLFLFAERRFTFFSRIEVKISDILHNFSTRSDAILFLGKFFTKMRWVGHFLSF